jgi:hypothetical protein
MRQLRVSIALFAAASVLAGCGGGGGDSNPPAPPGSVAVAPTITTQPANQSALVGATATFTVVASGTAPLSYQWRRGGANITSATAASYTTPATVIGDNGAQFSVVVSNTVGNVTSNNATLTVNPVVTAPTITAQPANQSVLVGAMASFSVTATGTAPLTYQWRRGGTNIMGATATGYTTPATVIGDNGAQFSVVVSNSAGNVTSNNATLTVNAAPVAPAITTQPASVSVAEGTPATFTVVATGTPAPTYQWQRGTTNIMGAASASYTLANPTVSADNNATFRVVVTNSAGSVTSNSATLTVTSSQAGEILRVALLALDVLDMATVPFALTDGTNFVAPNTVCGSGSVTGTLNSGALPAAGQAVPASGVLAATFANCAIGSVVTSTYNGGSTTNYLFTDTLRLTGTLNSTISNLRVVIRNGTTVESDLTGNGTTTVALTGSFVGSDVTQQITITPGTGMTMASGRTNRTATYVSGSTGLNSVDRLVGGSFIPASFAWVMNNQTLTIEGQTYVINGTLSATYNAQGQFQASTGAIVITRGGAQHARIVLTAQGVLSVVDIVGTVTPFSPPRPQSVGGRVAPRLR